MLQSILSLSSCRTSAKYFLDRFFSKVILKVLIITFIFSLPISSSAHRIYSWEPYKNLYEQENCNELINHLKPLSKPGDWIDNSMWSRSRILNSKCQLKLGNFKEALKSSEQAPESEERDIWLFQKIRVLLKSGDHIKAIANIRKLLKTPEKNSYLRTLQDDLIDEFNTDEEVSILFPLLHETRKYYKLFLSRYEIHSLYIRGAKLKKVKLEHKYRILGWQFPIDEKTARQSHKNLAKGDIIKLSPKEIFKRVRSLKNLDLNKYLIKHLPKLSKLLNKKEKGELGEVYLNSLFAEKYYSRIINLQKKGNLSKNWSLPIESQLFWTARSLIKKKNILYARRTIYKLERYNGKAKRLPILFDKFATRYMLDAEIQKAQFWWNRLLTHFPKNRLATETAWKLAWANLQKNNTNNALRYLKQGLKTKIYNSELKAKLLYWQGKILQSTGRNDLAEKSFKKLILNQPNTYYGMRLISSKNIPDSILAMVKTRKSKLYNAPTEPLSKKTKKLITRTEFLFDIAEPEQALRELFTGLGSYKNSTQNWHVIHMLHRRGEHHALLRIFANYYLPRMISLEVGDYPLWELAYPRPYWSKLKSFSNQAGIDPYFALAIMREESHFDPQALSSSKAIGLMQLMPATAKDVAKRKKIQLREKEDIFDPELNARLGTLYLGRLSSQFKSELIFTAGGYNAGPHNMNKWINRWNSKSLDTFVEQIPFKETRNYVKRVYRSYKLYKQIYSS